MNDSLRFRIQTDKPLIAQTDIVCYKILVYDEETNSFYFPNIYGCNNNWKGLEIGPLNSIMQDLKKEWIAHSESYDMDGNHLFDCFNVMSGYVDAYKDIPTNICITPPKVLVKCHIPKGCCYFEEMFKKRLCAKQIIIDEIIPYENIEEDEGNVYYVR